MPALDYEALAPWYDALVEGTPDLPFFLEECTRAGGPVLELMAGTGRLSRPLLERGIDLTCHDGSGAMLERLRLKLEAAGLEAPLLRQEASRLAPDRRFPLIILTFNSFEEIVEDHERGLALDRIHASLEPGGRFICTLHDPAVRLASVGTGREMRRTLTDPSTGDPVTFEVATWVARRTAGHGAVVEGRERITRPGLETPLLDLPLRFRLSSRDEFQDLVTAHGFEILDLYGGFTREPYRQGASPSMVHVLRRP